MIARIWRGAVRTDDVDEYADYMRQTGFAAYVSTPGNRGAWMLRRQVGDRTEFVMYTLWESLDAVKAFAGDEYEKAVFYPEDDRYLIERDLTSAHYEVEEANELSRPAPHDGREEPQTQRWQVGKLAGPRERE